MRIVVQRVTSASVSVDGALISRIDAGLLLYLGIGSDDDDDHDIEYLAAKVAGLRIFPDDQANMNRSVVDTGGAALVVSQFTLHGDARKGKRPSFSCAMAPGSAEPLYQRFCQRLSEHGVPCEQGRFGAMMRIASVNDGPVTILLDSKKLF
ncbi:MAG: D-aminoacyl-tRNA deacylase [Myxococcota bacterium]|jgi:D-tyrosyl-tRNA(Tyr) deacylase|nr:D-aminoacyl-tRNA deacylase [Myxococcota bacterium]